MKIPGTRLFVQVLFTAVPERKHYTGGKLNTTHVFAHGLIRAGRTAAAKSGLIRQITARVTDISGIGSEDIWIYIQDIPTEQLVEFGRVLPAPGEEEQRRNRLSTTKRQQPSAAGVTI